MKNNTESFQIEEKNTRENIEQTNNESKKSPSKEEIQEYVAKAKETLTNRVQNASLEVSKHTAYQAMMAYDINLLRNEQIAVESKRINAENRGGEIDPSLMSAFAAQQEALVRDISLILFDLEQKTIKHDESMAKYSENEIRMAQLIVKKDAEEKVQQEVKKFAKKESDSKSYLTHIKEATYSGAGKFLEAVKRTIIHTPRNTLRLMNDFPSALGMLAGYLSLASIHTATASTSEEKNLSNLFAESLKKMFDLDQRVCTTDDDHFDPSKVCSEDDFSIERDFNNPGGHEKSYSFLAMTAFTTANEIQNVYNSLGKNLNNMTQSANPYDAPSITLSRNVTDEINDHFIKTDDLLTFINDTQKLGSDCNQEKLTSLYNSFYALITSKHADGNFTALDDSTPEKFATQELVSGILPGMREEISKLALTVDLAHQTEASLSNATSFENCLFPSATTTAASTTTTSLPTTSSTTVPTTSTTMVPTTSSTTASTTTTDETTTQAIITAINSTTSYVTDFLNSTISDATNATSATNATTIGGITDSTSFAPTGSADSVVSDSGSAVLPIMLGLLSVLAVAGGVVGTAIYASHRKKKKGKDEEQGTNNATRLEEIRDIANSENDNANSEDVINETEISDYPKYVRVDTVQAIRFTPGLSRSKTASAINRVPTPVEDTAEKELNRKTPIDLQEIPEFKGNKKRSAKEDYKSQEDISSCVGGRHSFRDMGHLLSKTSSINQPLSRTNDAYGSLDRKGGPRVGTLRSRHMDYSGSAEKINNNMLGNLNMGLENRGFIGSSMEELHQQSMALRDSRRARNSNSSNFHSNKIKKDALPDNTNNDTWNRSTIVSKPKTILLTSDHYVEDQFGAPKSNRSSSFKDNVKNTQWGSGLPASSQAPVKNVSTRSSKPKVSDSNDPLKRSFSFAKHKILAPWDEPKETLKKGKELTPRTVNAYRKPRPNNANVSLARDSLPRINSNHSAEMLSSKEEEKASVASSLVSSTKNTNLNTASSANAAPIVEQQFTMYAIEESKTSSSYASMNRDNISPANQSAIKGLNDASFREDKGSKLPISESSRLSSSQPTSTQEAGKEQVSALESRKSGKSVVIDL